jgi:NADH-quinone oxidoreductase subunit C
MVTTPWADELTAELKTEFGDDITQFASYLGQNFLVCKPSTAVPILSYLKTHCGFDYLVDVTAAHWPKRDEPFDLIYILYSFSRNLRIRIKTALKEGERASSAFPVHVTADWLEREVFDMFGVEFTGHPGLKRILMPDEWQGHPLRKDYNILTMDNHWVRENLGIENAQ